MDPDSVKSRKSLSPLRWKAEPLQLPASWGKMRFFVLVGKGRAPGAFIQTVLEGLRVAAPL